MKRLLAWLKELWAAPYGRCSKHGEPLDKVFHFADPWCWSCRKEERQERDRLMAEADDRELRRKARIFAEEFKKTSPAT